MSANPFADTPDARPEECDIRPRGRWKAEETVGLGKGLEKKPRETDFSALQRRWFRDHGWTFERVERPNAFGRVTVDLWGFGDWLICKPGEGIVLVQTCAGRTKVGGGDASKRLRKARSKPELAVWLAAGGRFQVHAWSQPGGPGTRWTVEVLEVSPAA